MKLECFFFFLNKQLKKSYCLLSVGQWFSVGDNLTAPPPPRDICQCLEIFLVVKNYLGGGSDTGISG